MHDGNSLSLEGSPKDSKSCANLTLGISDGQQSHIPGGFDIVLGDFSDDDD